MIQLLLLCCMVYLMFDFFLLEQESLLEAFYALGDDGTHVSFVLS